MAGMVLAHIKLNIMAVMKREDLFLGHPYKIKAEDFQNPQNYYIKLS